MSNQGFRNMAILDSVIYLSSQSDSLRLHAFDLRTGASAPAGTVSGFPASVYGMYAGAAGSLLILNNQLELFEFDVAGKALIGRSKLEAAFPMRGLVRFQSE
jgi:hypothetical protein